MALVHINKLRTSKKHFEQYHVNDYKFLDSRKIVHVLVRNSLQ